MPRWSIRASMVVLCFVFLSGAGCNSDARKRPPMGKVKGTVTYKGDPVANAVVTFTMEGMPRGSTGTTDDEGRFRLTTYDTNDGAFVGTNKVTVTRGAESVLGKEPEEMTPEDLEDMMKKGLVEQPVDKKKADIPSKYAAAKTTPLQYEIDPGSNEKTIELED